MTLQSLILDCGVRLDGEPLAAKTAESLARSIKTAATPFCITSPRKSCPSNRSPASAMNKSPACAWRESVQTRPANDCGEPFTSSPPHALAINFKLRLSIEALCWQLRAFVQAQTNTKADGERARPGHRLPRQQRDGPQPVRKSERGGFQAAQGWQF